jgi:hypothetical protein
VADDTLAEEQERGAAPGDSGSEEAPGGLESASASTPEDPSSVEPAEQAQDLPNEEGVDAFPYTTLAQAQAPVQDIAGQAQAFDPYEGAVPPGYDWPTHGGYLGCLMGLVAAFLIGGFLGSFLVGLISVTPLALLVASPAMRIILIACVFVATLIALGRAGWVLGKRFYREYPRRVGR